MLVINDCLSVFVLCIKVRYAENLDVNCQECMIFVNRAVDL